MTEPKAAYHETAFTLNSEPNPEVRSEGMSDEVAAAVQAGAAELAASSMQVVIDGFDPVSREVTAHVENAPEARNPFTNDLIPARISITWGDGSHETYDDVEATPQMLAVSHVYESDGVYTIAAYVLSETATYELAVNWPAPFPDEPQPFSEAT
jgi:hypothetical protein